MRRLAAEVLLVAGGLLALASCAHEAAGFHGDEVPEPVVEQVESAPDDLEALLAPEAGDLADPETALPEGAVVEVRDDTWSEVEATASLVAEVTVPGADPVAFLVVLSTEDPDDPEDRGWRIAGTFLLDEDEP